MKRIAKRIYLTIMVAQCLLWIGFGIYGLLTSEVPYLYGLIAVLMIVNGVIFGVLAYLADRTAPLIRIGTFLFLAANTLLTIADQMGLFDYAVLALNLIAIVCLIMWTKALSQPR